MDNKKLNTVAIANASNSETLNDDSIKSAEKIEINDMNMNKQICKDDNKVGLISNDMSIELSNVVETETVDKLHQTVKVTTDKLQVKPLQNISKEAGSATAKPENHIKADNQKEFLDATEICVDNKQQQAVAAMPQAQVQRKQVCGSAAILLTNKKCKSKSTEEFSSKSATNDTQNQNQNQKANKNQKWILKTNDKPKGISTDCTSKQLPAVDVQLHCADQLADDKEQPTTSRRCELQNSYKGFKENILAERLLDEIKATLKQTMPKMNFQAKNSVPKTEEIVQKNQLLQQITEIQAKSIEVEHSTEASINTNIKTLDTVAENKMEYAVTEDNCGIKESNVTTTTLVDTMETKINDNKLKICKLTNEVPQLNADNKTEKTMLETLNTVTKTVEATTAQQQCQEHVTTQMLTYVEQPGTTSVKEEINACQHVATVMNATTKSALKLPAAATKQKSCSSTVLKQLDISKLEDMQVHKNGKIKPMAHKAEAALKEIQHQKTTNILDINVKRNYESMESMHNQFSTIAKHIRKAVDDFSPKHKETITNAQTFNQTTTAENLILHEDTVEHKNTNILAETSASATLLKSITNTNSNVANASNNNELVYDKTFEAEHTALATVADTQHTDIVDKPQATTVTLEAKSIYINPTFSQRQHKISKDNTEKESLQTTDKQLLSSEESNNSNTEEHNTTTTATVSSKQTAAKYLKKKIKKKAETKRSAAGHRHTEVNRVTVPRSAVIENPAVDTQSTEYLELGICCFLLPPLRLLQAEMMDYVLVKLLKIFFIAFAMVMGKMCFNAQLDTNLLYTEIDILNPFFANPFRKIIGFNLIMLAVYMLLGILYDNICINSQGQTPGQFIMNLELKYADKMFVTDTDIANYFYVSGVSEALIMPGTKPKIGLLLLRSFFKNLIACKCPIITFIYIGHQSLVDYLINIVVLEA